MVLPESTQTPEKFTLEMDDAYETHCRRWGAPEGEDVILMLHGGMSHSAWQAPLAEAIQDISDISFVASDRRGCGLNNEHRGDLKSAEHIISDITSQVAFLKKTFSRVHLAGWCQGAQYASVAATQMQPSSDIASLLLITPGFFWSERFEAVIQIAQKIILSMLTDFQLSPSQDHAFVTVPLLASDFTPVPQWQTYIDNDQLRTEQVTMNASFIMSQLKEDSVKAILEVTSPIFAAFASKDKIVNVESVEKYIAPKISEDPRNRMMFFDTGHAIHFEKPKDLATALHAFIKAL